MEVVYIGLSASKRDDGKMFVVSTTHPYICAVVEDQDWKSVKDIVKTILEANFGPVESLKYVQDDGKLPPDNASDHVPPAHVIAARVAVERAGIS